MSADQLSENKSLETISFEEGMQKLEAIVRSLEDGKTSLEEAIKAYELGTQLRNHLENLIKTAELRVEQMTLSSDGKPARQPADETLTSYANGA